MLVLRIFTEFKKESVETRHIILELIEFVSDMTWNQNMMIVDVFEVISNILFCVNYFLHNSSYYYINVVKYSLVINKFRIKHN
jgi:hypothetical protein